MLNARGQSTSDDELRTHLIGTPDQIARPIASYRTRGVDLILGGFLHVQDDSRRTWNTSARGCADVKRQTRIRSARPCACRQDRLLCAGPGR